LLLATLGGLVFTFPLQGAETKSSSKYKLVDETVAIVNGEPILASDVKIYMLLFGINDPQKALKDLENIYLVVQYAESRGLTVNLKQAQQMVLNFAKSQGISLEQLYKELQKVGLGGSVFQNFLVKYNLYKASIELFVLKPLLEDKETLDFLIAEKLPKAQPYYTIELLKIPKKIAEKKADLLVSADIKKISQKLGFDILKLTVNPNNLKPQLARVIKRLKAGQTDFAEDKNYIYLVKVDKIEFKIPQDARQKALEEIKKEKIEAFIKKLKNEAIIKELVPLKELRF